MTHSIIPPRSSFDEHELPIPEKRKEGTYNPRHLKQSSSSVRETRASLKKYTAIAQATRIGERKVQELRIRRGITDVDLYRALTVAVDCEATDEDGPHSFDALSDKFKSRLSEGRVVALPTVFFSLQVNRRHDEQDEFVTRSLDFLKAKDLISLEISFWGGFELPWDLNDQKLPDLLAKLAISQLGINGAASVTRKIRYSCSYW